MTTLDFHLRSHSTALPSTHLTSPTFPLPSHIKGQQSTLIRKSSNSHDQMHCTLYIALNYFHPGYCIFFMMGV